MAHHASVMIFLVLSAGVIHSCLSYTATLASDLNAEELVTPIEAAYVISTYRVFRTLRLQLKSSSGNTDGSSYQFREVSGGFPTDLSPQAGIGGGAVAASSVQQRTTANCSKSIVLANDDDSGAIIDGTSSQADITFRNLYALLTMSQLVPLSPTEAMIYIVPNRDVFEALPFTVRVTFAVAPACLEDISSGTPLNPTTTFTPVNITTRLTPVQKPFTDAQDISILAMVASGIVLGAPHAAAHAPRMLLGTITRRCLPLPESPVPYFLSPTAGYVDVTGIADDVHVRMLAWGMFQWWVVSLGISLVGLIAVCCLACSRRNGGSGVAGATQAQPVASHSDLDALSRGPAVVVCCGGLRSRLSSAFDLIADASCTLRFPSLVVLVSLPAFTYIAFTSVALLLSLSAETVALLGVGGMVWILVVLMVTLLLLVGAFRFVYVPWSHDVHRPPAPSVSSLTTDEAGALNEESQQQQHAPVGERRNAMLSILFGTGKWEDLNSLEIDNTAAEDAVHSLLLTATNDEDINKKTRQGAAKTNLDDGNHDTIGSGPCTRSCRFILQEYDDRGSFFICVDLVMTAACGGIQGASVAWTASYENCSSLLYGALGALGVYWLIAVLRRPFRYGYVSVLNALLTSLEIASVGWELYRTRHPIGYDESINRNGESSMNTVSNSIVYAGITLVGLKLLLDILVGWYGVYRCCFTMRSDHGRGELRRRLQQRRREIARVRAAKDAQEMKEFLRTTHMVDDELIALAAALNSVDEDQQQQQREWLARITQLRLMWSLSHSESEDVSEVVDATRTLVNEIRTHAGGVGGSGRIGKDWKVTLRKCDTVEEAARLFVDVWSACHTLPGQMRREDDDGDGDNDEVRGMVRSLSRAVSMRKILLQDEVESSKDGDEENEGVTRDITVEAEGVPFRAKELVVEPGDPQDVLHRNASLARIDEDSAGANHRGSQVSALNRFRSSRAVFGHVTSEDVNYAVAPGVSRTVFLQHQEVHSPRISTFSQNDAVFSRHLYKFEEI